MHTYRGHRAFAAVAAALLCVSAASTGVSAPSAGAKLVAVGVEGPPEAPRLVLRLLGQVQPELARWVANPGDRAVVDLPGVTSELPLGNLPIRHPSVKRVVLGALPTGGVRVVVELKGPYAFQLEPRRNPQEVAVAFRASTQPPAGSVFKVTVQQVADGVQVRVEATRPFSYQLVGSGGAADRMVLDLRPLRLESGSQRLAGVGAVREVRLGAQGPDAVRLVVQLTRQLPVRVSQSAGGRELVVVVPEATPQAAAPGRVAAGSQATPDAPLEASRTSAAAAASAPSGAQTAQAPQPRADGPARECFDRAKPEAARLPDERRITLTFLNERLAVILAAISRLTGVNVVVPPEPGEKRLTIRLANVTLREALDLVTRALGLTYVLVDRNVLVVPPKEVPPEATVTCLYRIRYASAEALEKTISATPPVQVKTDAATNSLLVVAPPADQERIWQLVQRLDVPQARPAPTPAPPPPPPRTTRLYPLRWVFVDEQPRTETGRLTTVPPEDVGKAIVELVRAHAGLRPEEIAFDYRQNALVVTATEAQHARVRQILDQIDVPAEQLLIEATVVDLNLRDLKDLGIEWTVGNLAFNELPTNPGQILFNPITRGPLSFTGVIGLLVEQGRARLLSNPRVATRDGQPASILVGDKLFIQISGGTDAQGRPIVITRDIEVGVRLNITPKINPEGDITLRILTEVSSLVGTPTPQLVQVRTRQAVSTLRVREGSAIVLAGLIQNEERRRVVKVPLLGDLPVIGSLFRREETERTESEVVFVITPRRLPKVLAPATPPPSPTPSPTPAP